MSGKITVVAPAHLHAGNMDLTGDLGRLYGTVGFTLHLPHTVIEFQKSNSFKISGVDRENTVNYVHTFIEKYKISDIVSVNVKESIPKHLGMGSQTALALSIAAGLSELCHVNINLAEVSRALGRSDRVGLGFHSFKYGGFIVDGGFRTDCRGEVVPPLIFRHPIPEDWVFIVCIPNKPVPEVLKIKRDEENVLKNLGDMPKDLSCRLSRIVLMQLMPSIMEHDVEVFGKYLTEFNKLLGLYWRDTQGGGVYCHPLVEAGINLMLNNRLYGACQSCWGPTFYGITDSMDKALEVSDKLKTFLQRHGGGLIFYTTGNNHGAVVLR